MRHVAVSEFKDHASELIAAAERGEEIVITRHGKPTARLVAAAPEVDIDKRRRALEGLAKLRESMRTRGMTATVQELIDWKNEGRR